MLEDLFLNWLLTLYPFKKNNFQQLSSGEIKMPKTITRDELLTKQHELIDRVTAIKRDFEHGLDPDLEEQALQLENYEVLQRLLEQANAELDKIDEQLKRMALVPNS